jgi:hypothetical protein
MAIKLSLQIEDQSIEAECGESSWKVKLKDGFTGKEAEIECTDTQMGYMSLLALASEQGLSPTLEKDARKELAPLFANLPKELQPFP